MNDFYSVVSIDYDDSEFAFCEPIDNANYAETSPKCPKCGMAVGFKHWEESIKVVLSNPKYGDFVCGLDFLVSERFKNAYEKAELKGIKQFLPVEIAKVRYIRNSSPLPPKYYCVDIEYSFARIDKENSIIMGKTIDRYCELCQPFGTTIDEIRSISIDATDWGGEDIFHLHETGGAIYASQNFIDFCLLNKFTNFKYMNTKAMR